MEKQQRTGKTFIGVSVAIFFSKILGFCRDIVFASVFGTTVLTDAFQVIFSFPGLLFASIGTALSSVNIPDLTYFITSRSKEERDRYLSNLFAHIALWGALLSLLGMICAPAITRLIAPGLSGDVVHIAVVLTRIMLPTLLFVSLTYVTAGVLQVHGYFLLSAAISIPFNLLIIAALVFKGDDIVLLGYVTTIGWLLQFLIQFPVLIKEKYRFFWSLDFKNEQIANVFRQLAPILLGNSLLQLCLIVDRAFGTHLGEGTTAALAFGSNLFITVTSVFIVAMSTVVFPRLSKYCLERDYPQVRQLMGSSFKILMFILIPYLILVITYNKEIITLVYERGAFTAKSTGMTSAAFLFYSFAVVGYACQEIFNRFYYALKKYKIPMLASMFCLGLKLLLDLLLYRSAGLVGISASTAFCLLVYAIIMSIMTSREIGGFSGSGLLVFALRMLPALAVMLGVILVFKLLATEGLIMAFLLPLVLSGCAYLAAARLTRIDSVFYLREEKKP